MTPLRNEQIAELLIGRSEELEGRAQKALRRAARLAFVWPVQAHELLDSQRSVTELAGVGPFTARFIEQWALEGPEPPPPPAIREGFLTMASANRILDQHGWEGRAWADLQVHSEHSDGYATILEIAEAAASLGRSCVAITDHSRTLKIAGGLEDDELLAQSDEIEAANQLVPSVRVLKGVEMNLDLNGQGDVSPDVLDRLDIVLGAFHSKLRLKEDQTQRYLAAVDNPHVHVLAHPRGRIYNFRLGLTADWQAVFARAVELDKAVEIDSFPDRQDLNVALLKTAVKEGVRISIGTDAHRAEQLGYLRLGIAAAVEAGVPEDRIVNLMSPDELMQWTASLREQASFTS